MDIDDDLNSEIEDTIEYIVTEDMADIRIDKYLSVVNPDFTRSYIQKLIKDQKVMVNNRLIKSSFKIKNGQAILLNIPKPIMLKIEPEDLSIDIIYEDNDIILINKEKGMVVHPSKGHKNHTLVNALLHHCKGELSRLNGDYRPGIVHRLDKDTTGIMVACKNDNSLKFIGKQFEKQIITRHYQAIVFNTYNEISGRVEAPIGRNPKNRTRMAINEENGKHAVTNYKVLETLGHKYSHIQCSLETGRTHQIRVHMASINHPLLGDTIYGPKKQPFSLDGQVLHASRLGFVHPRTKKYMEFQAPLPDYFNKLLDKLRKS